MPIIPQFRAEGPAQPVAPGMESPAGLRVNATTALRGIATLADSLGNVTQDMPNAPADLGQGVARGMQAIGEGIGNVGEVMFDIRKRLAEAWNYRKVSEAQDAMYGEVANFEKWKLTEPNPTKWETEWNGRMERMKNDLISGEDLSPAAKEQIGTRVMSFGTRHGFQVGVEAAKKVVDLANESNSAEIMRAMQAGDMDTVKTLTQYAVDQGWKGADWAEQTNWRASESIRKDAIESAEMQSAALVIRGEGQKARKLIEEAPYETEEQRQYKLAFHDKDVTSREVQLELINRARDGEDVGVLIEELTATNEDGTFKKHDGILSPIMREEALQPLRQFQNEQYKTQVDLADQYVAAGRINSEEELNDFFQGKPIDAVNRNILVSKIDKTFKETQAAQLDLMSKIVTYDPSKDIGGAQATAYEAAIVQAYPSHFAKPPFKNEYNPMAVKTLEVLEKLKRGESLTLAEEQAATAKKTLDQTYRAGVNLSVRAKDLKQREINGRPVFVDFTQKPEPGDPTRFEEEQAHWFKNPTQNVGRVIQLNQQDYEAALAGKDVYVTDMTKEQDVAAKVAKDTVELQRRINVGEVTPDNLQTTIQGLQAPYQDAASEKMLESSLFRQSTPDPVASPNTLDKIEEIKERAKQLKASATF
jgi:hypothetical protein